MLCKVPLRLILAHLVLRHFSESCEMPRTRKHKHISFFKYLFLSDSLMNHVRCICPHIIRISLLRSLPEYTVHYIFVIDQPTLHYMYSILSFLPDDIAIKRLKYTIKQKSNIFHTFWDSYLTFLSSKSRADNFSDFTFTK